MNEHRNPEIVGQRAAGRVHGPIARELGVAIVGGRFAPGELLSGEIERSEELNVSRSVYREAIRVLAAKGLVESRRKAGTRVSPRRRWNLLDPDVLEWTFAAGPTESFLRDLFELRMIVEPAAAALAAERRDGRDLARMGHALEEMDRIDRDAPEWQAADERFHDAILVASRNELLVSMSSSIEAALVWMNIYKIRCNVSRDLQAEHHAVYETIAVGDPQAARLTTEVLVRAARAEVAPTLGG